MKSTSTKKFVSKCDVIIPIYNAPDWVKLCVYALFVNTPEEYLNTVYLMNDNSDKMTLNTLKNLKEKYGEKIKILTNKENLGFVKNVNKGLRYANADYILLLNSDCLVSKNTIPKLLSHMEKDNDIGLISPIASNAANLTLEMFDGFSYTQMDQLLEKKFKGQCFDACTVVGNCLMLSKECINKVGYLDEVYGMGYGEETDYQFEAMSKGFTAKIAIDTYVYHKAEVSFGTSKKKQERLKKNRELFFERWGEEYARASEKYHNNDPIEYIKNNLEESDYNIIADTLFFLPEITQNAGGCHVVFDIVNYMVINGKNVNILYEKIHEYQEISLFKPIKYIANLKIQVKRIVATIWISTFRIRLLAKKLNVPIINLIQGYENYFDNGNIYNSVVLSHKLADSEIVISRYLQDKLKEMFNVDSTLIENGINLDLIKSKNNRKKAKSITFVLRNNPMKGDYILSDIIRILDNTFRGLNINVVCMSEFVEVPFVRNNSLCKIIGPVSRQTIINLLQETDIYVDASVNEGFGLIGLEAMASGAVVVMSNSFGVLSYLEDGVNGYLINEVNDSHKYTEKVTYLLENPKDFVKMKENANKTSDNFDYDKTIKKYIKFFEEFKHDVVRNKDFTSEEKKIIMNRDYVVLEVKPKGLPTIKILSKLIPKFIKEKLKNFISWLYSLYDHS